jgi:hypothetical protein
MDNYIKNYIVDMKRQIENRNRTSDNKAYHIRTEKTETIKFLLDKNRINQTDLAEALKIIGLKSFNP